MRNKETTSPEETFAFGRAVALELKPGIPCCFKGDLGAGKTTLIKGIVSAFLPKEEVTSPTFSYLHSYTPFLHHFDLYRLEGESDFLEKGFADYFTAKNLCLVEWPEKIAALLPKSVMIITLSYTGENTRLIEVSS